MEKLFTDATNLLSSLSYDTKSIDSILRVDMKVLHIDEQEFISANRQGVKIALDTWFALIFDITHSLFVTEKCVNILKGQLKKLGFVGTVKSCGDLLQSYLENIEGGGDPRDKRYHLPTNRLVGLLVSTADSGTSAVSGVCQALAYLQRFTLITEATHEASMKSFMESNDRCKAFDKGNGFFSAQLDDQGKPIVNNHNGRKSPAGYTVRATYPSITVINAVKENLKAILGKRPITWSYEDGAFSSGTTAQGANNIPDKCRELAQLRDNYDGYFHHPTGSTRTSVGYPYQVCEPTLIAVPKVLERGRVIGPEDVAMAYYGQAALKALRARLTSTGAMEYINAPDVTLSLHSRGIGQEVNRELALSGSSNGKWATIDLHAASDSIVRRYFFAVCPEQHRAFFANFTHDYVYVDRGKGKQKVRLQLLFTSGSPLTWDTEAAYFLAIAWEGVRMCGHKDYKKCVWAYGDDLIVPTDCYETVVDLLEAFGHIVNRNKSYCYGGFRESCGGWFYDGCDVTPVFWPRRSIDPKNPEDIASLVQLQHHMFEGCRFAANTLSAAIKRVEPRMTESPVGYECDDLWSDTAPTDTYDEIISHLVLRPIRVNKTNPAFEHWLYYHLLKHGPSYNSSLDELLHVSDSPRRAASTTKMMEWTLAKPLAGAQGDAERIHQKNVARQWEKVDPRVLDKHVWAAFQKNAIDRILNRDHS